jgi:hypothetical protein
MCNEVHDCRQSGSHVRSLDALEKPVALENWLAGAA